jgi:hypothetical protein
MKLKPFLSTLATLVVVSMVAITSLVVSFPATAQTGCGTTNVAQGKPVTASSTENAGTPATAAVDGSTTTRWSSAHGVDPQWIRVDLGTTQSVCRVVLRWEAAYGKSYQIQTSNDGTNWTNIYTTTTGDGGVDDLTNLTGSGRYVRMNGTVRATQYGYSLWEFEIYTGSGGSTNTPTATSTGGSPLPRTGWTATASSIPTDPCCTGNVPANTLDGNASTRWSTGLAQANGQWIRLDMATAQTFNKIVLDAGTSTGDYPRGYQVFVSNDGTNWGSAVATGNGTSAVTTITFATQTARYLRVVQTGTASSWWSIHEYNVYSPGGPTPTPTPTCGCPTNTPTNTPAVTNTPTNTQPPSGPVDFGPNVHIFDTSMSASSIQSVINSVYNAQQNNHFGDRRDALVFKPGTYAVDIGVGFYTEVLGLGAAPDAVRITGNLHSDAFLGGNNATQNFWRGATNFSVAPSNGTVKWAVSQAIWFRQMHVLGNIALHQSGGWASGGWMANTKIDNNVDFGSQQQWISRNTQAASWSGGAWNMVFVGVTNPPSGTWPSPPYTKIATAPIIREKPFLQIDGSGNYSVRVPSFKSNSSGYDWGGGSVPGTTIPISQFYIAHAGDSAATINAQLASGKHLILTPGIYTLNDTIRVNNANTVVLGMGLATLRPTTGLATMSVADVDGVIIAGVLFDAGTTNSPVQLEVGTVGNTTSHAANPIVLHDVIFRVGGAAAGKTNISMRINAYDTIVDHTWVWRADHGTGVGWTSNTSANGVIVNGNNVTMYGLFVEHYQQYQTLWNGQGGRVYFYQSEDPYDPPNQASWTSGSGVNGWASYKVSNSVTSHEGWGLGIYSVFSNTGVNQTRAMEVPVNANVKFHSMVIKDLANGNIQFVINNTAGPTVNNFP